MMKQTKIPVEIISKYGEPIIKVRNAKKVLLLLTVLQLIAFLVLHLLYFSLLYLFTIDMSTELIPGLSGQTLYFLSSFIFFLGFIVPGLISLSPSFHRSIYLFKDGIMVCIPLGLQLGKNHSKRGKQLFNFYKWHRIVDLSYRHGELTLVDPQGEQFILAGVFPSSAKALLDAWSAWKVAQEQDDLLKPETEEPADSNESITLYPLLQRDFFPHIKLEKSWVTGESIQIDSKHALLTLKAKRPWLMILSFIVLLITGIIAEITFQTHGKSFAVVLLIFFFCLLMYALFRKFVYQIPAFPTYPTWHLIQEGVVMRHRSDIKSCLYCPMECIQNVNRPYDQVLRLVTYAEEEFLIFPISVESAEAFIVHFEDQWIHRVQIIKSDSPVNTSESGFQNTYCTDEGRKQSDLESG